MSFDKKEAYRLVGNEIKHQDFEPACLSSALEESEGDYNLAMSIYVRKRVESLRAELVIKNLRKNSFNERQQDAAVPFVGYAHEEAPFETRHQWLSIGIGHLCLITASFGIMWAASIHFKIGTWEPLNDLMIFIVWCTNLLPGLFFLSIRTRFPDYSYQRIVLTWASIMCLISFGLGLLILRSV